MNPPVPYNTGNLLIDDPAGCSAVLYFGYVPTASVIKVRCSETLAQSQNILCTAQLPRREMGIYAAVKTSSPANDFLTS
jgi:hypothetical protein